MPRLLNIFQKKRAATTSPGAPIIDESADYNNQFKEVESFTYPIHSTEHEITILRTAINNIPAYFAIATNTVTGKSFYFTDHNHYIYYHPSKEVLKRRVVEVLRVG